MKHRQLPLLALLVILFVGGVWFLNMDQEPTLAESQNQVDGTSSAIEAATQSDLLRVTPEREEGISRVSKKVPDSTQMESLDFAVELIPVGETSISGWQLGFISLDDGKVVPANALTNLEGKASFPRMKPGRFALEGALMGKAAFRVALVIVDQDTLRIPLELAEETFLQIVDEKSGNPLADVECYLADSHMLAGRSDAMGRLSLFTQMAQLRFEKERYADSYALDSGGESEVVWLRPEIEVRVELAQEWLEYTGFATAIFENTQEAITDYAAYYSSLESEPEPEPFDYLRYRQDFDFGNELSATVKVPEGLALSMDVQKGGAVVSLKTEALQEGQVIYIPAPSPVKPLNLYLRSPNGELVKGDLRAVGKKSARVLEATWSEDHWVIAQPEQCAHLEIEVDGCSSVWCWPKETPGQLGGFLELQLVEEQIFEGVLDGQLEKKPLPLLVTLAPAEYDQGIDIHQGWISKLPGNTTKTLLNYGAFEMGGMSRTNYVVRTRPAAQVGRFGKVVGEVPLPQESSFVISGEGIHHYQIRCTDASTGAPIMSFAGTNQELGLSTEAQMGLWQGWAEEGDAFLFRSTGYVPLEVRMPLTAKNLVELKMQASVPMFLKIEGLTETELSAYSTISFSLMRMMGDDLVTMSFAREFAITGMEIEAYFPADGEWVVASLRKNGDSTQGRESEAFRWEPRGTAVLSFE